MNTAFIFHTAYILVYMQNRSYNKPTLKFKCRKIITIGTKHNDCYSKSQQHKEPDCNTVNTKAKLAASFSR